MNFSVRSYKKELLDRDDIPFADIRQNMQELDFINARLGGHKITLAGVRNMIQRVKSGLGRNNERLSILEIGCGGGDNLRVIKRYCVKKNIAVQLSGLDINPHCVQFAQSRWENEGIEFISSDYKLAEPFQNPILFLILYSAIILLMMRSSEYFPG